MQAMRSLARLSPVRKWFSTSIAEPDVYTLSMKLMHWGTGIGVLGCFGTVHHSVEIPLRPSQAFDWQHI